MQPVETRFNRLVFQFPPKILRISGRRELQGVKSAAHVAGFDGLSQKPSP
jgi:hypothetical protein